MNSGRDFHRSVVAVCNASGHIHGTGWVAAPGAIVTCDHVLVAAGCIGDNPAAIQVPGSRVIGVERRPDYDLALLRLEAPAEAPPLATNSGWSIGHRVYSFGFDSAHQHSEFPYGHPMDPGEIAAGLTTLVDNGVTQQLVPINGVKVNGGQSGGPVWSEQLEAVIGVITRSNKNNLAYAIPIEDVLGCWKELTKFANTMIDLTRPRCIDLPERVTAAGLGRQGLVGRTEALRELGAKLGADREVALTSTAQATALHGAGGIGKSALAIEYCHQTLDGSGWRPKIVWWVNAENDLSTAASCRSLLDRLGVEIDETLPLQVPISNALASVDGWLAVFDNVPDVAAFNKWRPQCGGGLVMITTRDNRGWPHAVPVDLIRRDDARAWLTAAANDPLDSTQTAAIEALVDELGGLSLALAIAAAQLQTMAPDTYLRHFQSYSYEIMSDQDAVPADYDKTIYKSLAVARSRLRGSRADAAIRLLELASFFAPDQIPLRLFTPESLDVATEWDVNQARETLLQLSIISPDPAGTSYFAVHRLVQAVTRFSLYHPTPSEANDQVTP